MQPDESLCDGPAHLGVHGEAGPVPVHAGAKGAELGVDVLPILLLPAPDLLHESFAAQVMAAESFLPGYLLLYHHLATK